MEYTYDQYGQRVTMLTYRTPPASNAEWTDDIWPTPSVSPDETHWLYDDATGLLAAKEYDDETQTEYDYTPDGRLHCRTWAREVDSEPLQTEYDYATDTLDLAAMAGRPAEEVGRRRAGLVGADEAN